MPAEKVSPAADSRSAGRPLQAVLFDMDGLLVDSEPVWTVAEEELAVSLGGTWSAELKAEIVGTTVASSVPKILAWYGSDRDPAEVSGWLMERMAELFSAALPLRPGALRLLDDLGEAGVPLALVSSSYRILVDAALREIGAGRFAVTIAGDEVGHAKPHPEPYRTAARRIGAEPGRCVVFEDAPSGIASAEAAGCIAVGVPDHAPIAATPRRPVLASLEDVKLDWLLELPATLD